MGPFTGGLMLRIDKIAKEEDYDRIKKTPIVFGGLVILFVASAIVLVIIGVS